MSSEQDPALVSASAPTRRRIVVAPKLADKPLALIVRDPELQAEFEAELGHARKVVVFPSLTHLCTDPVRTAWAGVVVARPCGFDSRLSSVVPENCIAFWRIREETYGWPGEVSHIQTREELERWLEDIKNPRPITRIVTPKRATKPRPGNGIKPPVAQKTQLKFELAVPRGVVASERPQQMPLAGIAEEPASQVAATVTAPTQPSESGLTKRSAKAPVTPVSTLRREKPQATRKARRGEQLALPAAQLGKRVSASERERIKRAVLRPSEERSPQKELLLMRLAAELGLTRAQELLEGLRTRASSIR